MSTLIALDPSIRSAGVAYFVDGELCSAETIRLKSTAQRTDRCLVMTLSVVRWVRSRDGGKPIELAVEWPKIYKATKSKGDPNDLLGLAGVCAGVAASLNTTIVHSYLPHEWAGQTKKSTKKSELNMRAERIKARLSPTELEVVDGLNHDGIDAVGIGLHHLGRFERRRVYPGASI